MSTIQSVNHGSSSASIVEELRHEILTGAALPGARLGEVALAQKHQVSRGPVREALRRLADQGLVTFVPNIGASVRQLTMADVGTLYELREALEADAARLAAERASAEDLTRLRHLLAQHAHTVAAHPAGAYLQGGGDADFHILLARISGNPLITRLLSDELYPQLILLRRQHRNVQGRGQIALQEHERIAEAIAARDGELASLLMRRHLRASRVALEGQLIQTENT